MRPALRLLIAEPDPALARALAAACGGPPLMAEIVTVGDLATAEAVLMAGAFDAVVAALELAGGDLAVIERLEPRCAGPLVVTSASGSVNVAVEAMRRGAADFLVKPFAPRTLAERVHGRLGSLRRSRAVAPAAVPAFEGFIGASPPMLSLYGQIDLIARSRAPVFITGESGTGKDVAASAIHARGGVTGAPFVALNCSAIPKDLMESEIFGHVRGAFTGATEDRAGAAELADRGTLFLDEICELPLALQAKLLRLIQTGELRRVGAAATRAVDVRFICATNRDPGREVAAGRFREDLFYRLHVLPLHLPPLRARAGDVMRLAEAFLARFSAEEGRCFTGFEPAAAALMTGYAWPGNVRELQNVIRRIVVLNDDGPVTAAMLPPELRAPQAPAAAPAPGGPVLPMWLQEQRIIEQALNVLDGNIARAAAALEISPSTIYRKRQGWAQRTAAE
jgi:two-component system repressor protein LuxO